MGRKDHPVKEGQIRWLWGCGNAVGLVARESYPAIDPAPSESARWTVGRSLFHDVEEVERLPLICPAVDDIAAGAVFAPMYGGPGVVIAAEQDGVGVGEFKTESGDRFDPIEACLKQGWRYVGNIYTKPTTPAGNLDTAIAHLLVAQANVADGRTRAPCAKAKEQPGVDSGGAGKIGWVDGNGWVFGDRVSWEEVLLLEVAPGATKVSYGAALQATVRRLYLTAAQVVRFAEKLFEHDIAREVKGLPEIASMADLSTWQTWVDKPRSSRLALGTGDFLVQALERLSYDVSSVARLMASENQAETVARLRKELARLREGIRAHRDTRVFDRRGWFDDHALHMLINDIPRPTSVKAGE